MICVVAKYLKFIVNSCEAVILHVDLLISVKIRDIVHHFQSTEYSSFPSVINIQTLNQCAKCSR